MTDKQYKCLNGDIIEVGKEYKDVFAEDSITKVIAFYNNKIIGVYERGDKPSYDEFNENEFVSLWQEQPDKDEWIKHTTGEQPVDDGVVVEIKIGGFTSNPGRAEAWGVYWEDGHITHYRIVEDKQEPEETEKTLSYLCGEVQQLKLKMEWVENYLKDATKWQK
jgi:hypothetical protein